MVTTALLVYADESGTQGSPQYCLVTGFLGSPRQWKYWSRDWQKVLDQYGIQNFHAKDFFNRPRSRAAKVSPYRGWSTQKAMQFIHSLASTVRARQLSPIGCAIHVPAFNSFSKGERRYLTNAALTRDGKFLTSGAPSRPYQYAFGLLVGESLRRAAEGTLIHFVLDENSHEQRYAIQTYNLVKARGTHPAFQSLGRISYADDQKELGLQLADLHVFSWHGALNDRARDNPERRHTMNILATKKTSIEIIDWQVMETRLQTELSVSQRARIKAL